MHSVARRIAEYKRFICSIPDAVSIRKWSVYVQSQWLTANEAAVYLGGLNHRTVTRWAWEGYLPAYPIGEGKRRLWRFLVHDLEQWMLRRRNMNYSSGPDTTTCTLGAATGAPARRNLEG